jgi:hypothetical protein
MKKNDKIIIAVGIVILLLASVGIYYWDAAEPSEAVAEVRDFFKVSSEYLIEPAAIAISDNCPFYPLIVTPVAVHYDTEGNQFIAPLYVEKPGEISNAVVKVERQLNRRANNELSSLSPKDFSLYIVEKYWKRSDAVLLIRDNESGYNLGVVATPISSYLGIPIIVTDEIDIKVREVLEKLGVTKSIICGDLDGYKNTLRFDNIDDIIDASIEVIWQRFGHDVKYITLTNPKDAWPPEILNKEIRLSEKGTLNSGNALPSGLKNMIKAVLLGKSPKFTFTIPDYKYALIKLDLISLHDPKLVEEFGDSIMITGSFTGYCRTVASPAIRNENGDLLYDRLHFETIVYDSAGEEFSIGLTSSTTLQNSFDIEITVTAEELENPYHAMMQQLSSVAPYLTAYHKGIVFAKPDFAFVPTDEVTLNGKTLPGNTQVLYNPMLIPVVNQHVYENVHIPLNNLLAKIKNIDISHPDDLKVLKEYCSGSDFVYIALVGDTIMLPQYYYRSPHSDPYTNPSSGTYGTNVPSDFIYGNVDPQIYSLLPYNEDHLENDIHSNFPEAENVVGRIVGWDVQDASALIARTIFYDDIIATKDTWKDNAAVLVGAGTEMQRLPIISFIRDILGKEYPMKFPSGEKKFSIQRFLENFESAGFNAQSAQGATAQRVGYTTEALLKIKKDGFLNLLLFPVLLVKLAQGYQNANDLLKPKWYLNSILGDQEDIVIGGKLQENSNLIISNSHAIWFEKEHGDIQMNAVCRPILLYQFIRRVLDGRIRTPLDQLGAYSVRDVSVMDMGPSVMLVEGCGSGKIDGIHPQNSLAIAYMHAGVNAYISPTTFSAFYGALEPRPNFRGGVGFGIVGYLKAALNARKGVYPDLNFNEYIFENMVLNMAKNDVPIGVALRDGKNAYLPAQFDKTFRWTPPLSIISNLPTEIRNEIDQGMKSTAQDMRFPVEKYSTIYQINLLGDPAFNPYEPINNG